MAKRHPQHSEEKISNSAGGGKRQGHSEEVPDQTKQPNEQDPERRLGNFVGAGEAAIKQPGGRRG